MIQCSFISVWIMSFKCKSSWLDNIYRLHVGIVAATIYNTNLLTGLFTMKETRCMLQAEWLYNNHGKCNAQILQRKTFIKSPPPHVFGMYFFAFTKVTSYEHKLFVVAKMKFIKWKTTTNQHISLQQKFINRVSVTWGIAAYYSMQLICHISVHNFWQKFQSIVICMTHMYYMLDDLG
jgi:hypothetical protein